MTESAHEDQEYQESAPAEDGDGAALAPEQAAEMVAQEVLQEQEVSPTPEAERQLAAERERSSGYLEELQRERASFINYRRRTEAEREGWSREANSALIFNILPVLDDFERARQTIPADQRDSAWVDGLMLVGRKLLSTLELAGLRPIEADGKPFDPALHEAVSVVPAGDRESGIVLEELRKGYKIGDRVLRPSMVVVTG
jgi:molecular chaperone GrpE